MEDTIQIHIYYSLLLLFNEQPNTYQEASVLKTAAIFHATHKETYPTRHLPFSSRKTVSPLQQGLQHPPTY